jgi:hypothetical protein
MQNQTSLFTGCWISFCKPNMQNQTSLFTLQQLPHLLLQNERSTPVCRIPGVSGAFCIRYRSNCLPRLPRPRAPSLRRPPTVAASSSSRAQLLRFQAEAARIRMRPRLQRLSGGGRRLAPPPPSAATDGAYPGRRGLRGTAALAGGERRQTRPLPPVLPSLVGGGLLRARAGDADPRRR